MNLETLDYTIQAWAKIGAAFSTSLAPHTPDLEPLILTTVHHIPHEPRLFTVTASWLCQYYELVAKHRLVALANETSGHEDRSILGFLLATVAEHTNSDHFKGVIALCHPASLPRPLYAFQHDHPILARIAEKQASKLSKQWNLWADPFEPKFDAIRPIAWVFKQNPIYRFRETFCGDLRSSIIETIRTDKHAGVSELELARRCQASRDAIRKALDRLERYGHIQRIRKGRNLSIVLAA